MSIESNIKNWLSLDNKIKILNQEISQLREKRNNYKDDILEHINKNSLNNATIKVGNEYLKFTENKYNSPLSYKFLLEALANCNIQQDDIENIINYIKIHRENKIIKDIKRFNK